MKYLLLLLPLLLSAQVLRVGDNVKPINLESQYEKSHTLISNGIWVISWDKKNSRVANSYFKSHGMPNNINLIVDIASAPSFIFRLFALSELQEFKHTILLSRDESYNKTLPHKEGFLTLLYIQNQKVSKIEYVQTLNILNNF